MPVRTAYAPVAGEVLTATNVARLAGGWIGYAEQTGDQGAITTEVDLTSLTVTVTVGTGRRIRISARTLVVSTVANDIAALNIKEGAAQLQTGRTGALSGTAVSVGISADVILTPTAGAHTYKLAMARETGTGTLTNKAAATAPAFIAVEDLGPAT